MPAKAHHPLVEDFLARLEEKDYRLTGTREEVARAVAQQGSHFTAEVLCEALPRVGRATVYRNVKLLVEMGFLCRVLMEDGELHYQVSHKGHHHHLICTYCGQSQDLLNCDFQGLLKEKASSQGFEVEGHTVELYGRCRTCASEATAA